MGGWKINISWESHKTAEEFHQWREFHKTGKCSFTWKNFMNEKR